MSAATVDYDSLAQQAGAVSSAPAPTQPQPSAQSGGAVDYDALAAQYGDVSQAPVSEHPGLDSEDEQFLSEHGDQYQYLPQDSRFPNRQPGIYPKGPGNEWRNDPSSPMASTTQQPVDLHLGAHSAEGAAAAAVATAPAMMPAAVSALAPALTKGIIGVGEWAEANPKLAKAIWEGIKLTSYGSALIHGLHKAVDIGGK